MTTYSLEFGKVGEVYPVPPAEITVDDRDENAFHRAVAAYAIPHLEPALEAAGCPEFADCFFRHDPERTHGDFLWLAPDFTGGASFCATRIERVDEAAA